MSEHHPSSVSNHLPIGTIVAYALSSNTVPEGWLVCDGTTIPSEYQDLIKLLQSTRTPDLRGRTLLGAGICTNVTQDDGTNPNFPASWTQGTGLLDGKTGGEAGHSLTVDELAPHDHTINGGDFGIHERSFKGDDDSDLPFETQHTGGGTDTTGSGHPHNTVQPYFSVNYIICAG